MGDIEDIGDIRDIGDTGDVGIYSLIPHPNACERDVRSYISNTFYIYVSPICYVFNHLGMRVSSISSKRSFFQFPRTLIKDSTCLYVY